jgi:hypothetical protein
MNDASSSRCSAAQRDCVYGSDYVTGVSLFAAVRGDHDHN